MSIHLLISFFVSEVAIRENCESSTEKRQKLSVRRIVWLRVPSGRRNKRLEKRSERDGRAAQRHCSSGGLGGNTYGRSASWRGIEGGRGCLGKATWTHQPTFVSDAQRRAEATARLEYEPAEKKPPSIAIRLEDAACWPFQRAGAAPIHSRSRCRSPP